MGTGLRTVIVNADDFGLSDHTVEWTIRGFECGALTSATLMAGMPATDRAVKYAKSHPQFSFGVHFYLVDERPISEPKTIPSMVNPKTGCLWPTRQFILRNFAGLIRVEDLKTEMRAQFLSFRNAGVPLSHVDGHGHNHRLPQSIKALFELREELGFKVVRRCQDLFCGKPGWLSRVINVPMQRRLAVADFKMTDHFLMNAGHSQDPFWFSKALRFLPEGVTEIGIHPGMDEPWRKLDTEDCFDSCVRLTEDYMIQLTNFNRLTEKEGTW